MADTDPAPAPHPPHPPDPPPAPPPGTGTEAASRLLLDLRSEIARADSKAAVLVAALGMSAGVVSGLLAGSDWEPAALSGTGETCWWMGTAALAASLVALLMAVLPRYRASKWAPGEPLTYFGDIRRAVRQERLAEALAATERAPAASLLVALAETSRIATRKHQWIRAGLVTFSIGAVLLPASLLIG
ncbi:MULTISPECIES: Pycsar system effector family protein [unclassified Streptomyces]|uniref:Pycsar system effector family protein n=1 Tax=unclassified Streptomyces TaxID=2593676 RepID=UPI002DD92824|nr:Pycsar system effector family protein [Streptomyces sp. NBC_01237]WRZ74426.1 DUF5706 domain-containing protein [Streptomyces sp. NBC_01237]